MTSGKLLCLNMIVRNETANLARCLDAVADHIACWVIGDTGSTDGTQDFIRSFFARRRLPGELHEFPFENFEQARNAALDHAYASPLAYDYLLFADADMELVVEDPGFRAGLAAPGYRLIQRAGSGLTYWNTRLARRHAGARYHGVTHEYLDVPGGVEELRGAWYKDHASGANRVDKFERDIRLLAGALEREPENHRTWFYLAQSYRDAGRRAEAAEAYAKRADMGGWDEEAWTARLEEARCRRELGDDGSFLRLALAAFNQRPQRAEPLYDLARYYRSRGMNHASALFAEAGLALPRPERDILFVEDFVYAAGLLEEYSIAANYATDPVRRDRGFSACNWLALSRDIPSGSRDLAWSNLFFYVQPAHRMLPSFAARPVGFVPPDGYRPLNPSVARLGEQIVLIQRAANYTLTDDSLDYRTPDGAPIQTRNFLLRLGDDLEIRSAAEILAPADLPAPAYPGILGFEDMRPFAWRDGLWCVACVRQLSAEGWCEQVLARIDETAPGAACRLAEWRVLEPAGPRRHQKNWMPRVADGRLQFVYLCDPTRLVDERAATIAEQAPAIAARHFRGGSQAIAFDGGWLAVVHEVQVRDAIARRFYLHRFVWFDDAGTLRRVSRPFVFHDKGVEFAAGMAWHPDGRRLLVSYSVADREAWIATVDAGEVARLLEDVERLPSGAEPAAGAAAMEAAVDAPPLLPVPVPVPVGGGKPAADAGEPIGVQDCFQALAPFLRAVDSPAQRRELSRDFDARIAPFLDCRNSAALPQIHCFYEMLSPDAPHHGLVAATVSMRAAGHPVTVWSYSPSRLDFLRPHGVAVRSADDVVPRGLFERILAASEIRYFSDVFRYAVLYEHGGLWLDSDVVLLRPFPFRGDHFINLQWRGGHVGHFVCGNVMYSEPYSRHLRRLYEISLERFFGSPGWAFGDVGPRLLSDYVASREGAELRERLFSPMFFNAIDWTEVDRFAQPMAALADYLNDERVFGIHLWNARTSAQPRTGDVSLIAALSDPLARFPGFTDLADRFRTDKNRVTDYHHGYARIYDRLLAPRRFALRRLMEVGLSSWNLTETPSVALWQAYFPFCHVTGVDRGDFSALNSDRFTSHICDQSNLDQIRAVAARLEPGSFDVIIDDGSHASRDQQQTLREFFPLLADGGWYFIEDLHWQPPDEDRSRIAPTETLLREIASGRTVQSPDPSGIATLAEQVAEFLFFDSHHALRETGRPGGLAAIRKRGGGHLVG